MKFDFDFNNIQHQELVVALDEPSVHYQLMVDKSVQDCLASMLWDSVSRFDDISYSEVPIYEFAEKYASTELVRASLSSDDYSKIKGLFETNGVDQNNKALDEIDRLNFYFYKVVDSLGRKLVAVKRATQFKGLATAHGRLVSWVKDDLTIMDTPVFRLDKDFDLIITSTDVFALRPNVMAYVAEVDEKATSAASERLNRIGEAISFLHIDRLKSYIEGHKRGAHLVSSIASRDDLTRFNKDKLVAACQEQGIQIEIIGEKLGPYQGAEIALLELLDSRRYVTSLTTDASPQVFVAMSRKSVQ